MARKRKPGKRTASGQLSRAGQTKADVAEALGTAVKARQRLLRPGLAEHALDPLAGCPAGRAVMSQAPRDEWPDLWTAILHMRRVYAAYDRTFGHSRFAKVVSILAPVGNFETSADAPAYDDRSDREKQDAAINAWMVLHGWMGRVSRQAMGSCVEAVIHQTDERVRDVDGMLACLRVVSRGIKGEYVRPT